MSEQTESTLHVVTDNEYDDFFLYIRGILEKDENLCNFSRYMDYGKIKDGIWNCIDCVLNCNNIYNVCQTVRFVKKLDTSFLDCLFSMNNTIDCDYSRSGLEKMVCSMFQFKKNTHVDQNNISDMISNMINVDCNYKISGCSLTPIDLICHNSNITESENRFYSSLINHISKIIFVGDKCYLLSIIDKFHNVYVSIKILKWIFDRDDTENKSVFNSIVKKLFNLISKFSFYFTNCTIGQLVENNVLNPLINRIISKNVLNTQDKIQLQTMDQLFLNLEEEEENYKKLEIYNKIKHILFEYLNSNTYISNIDLSGILSSMRKNLLDANKYLVQKAYRDGLKLNTIFTKMGWYVVDWEKESNQIKYDFGCFTNINSHKDHVFIGKRLNMIPKIAFVYDYKLEFCADKHNPFREIKDEYINQLSEYFYVRTIYLDITDGVMYCDGKHPNVNHGSVCMGDLKGKVTFVECNDDEIMNLLSACESLLSCMNYTSAYNYTYSEYFYSDEYSRPYEPSGKYENLKQDTEKIEDLDFVESTDIDNSTESEDSQNTETPSIENNDSGFTYESEDEYEEENENDQTE